MGLEPTPTDLGDLGDLKGLFIAVAATAVIAVAVAIENGILFLHVVACALQNKESVKGVLVHCVPLAVTQAHLGLRLSATLPPAWGTSGDRGATGGRTRTGTRALSHTNSGSKYLIPPSSCIWRLRRI